MAHQTLDHLFTCLGFVIWGDLGPTTIYRNKLGRVVFFEKTWPHKPPSPKQIVQQQRIRDAAQAWQALTPAMRKAWDQATKRASLCCTGYDFWVSYQLTADVAAVRTIERQTKITLLPP